MALEPSPGLDPTGGAASSIGEVTLYNIYETLTKINQDGSVTPLLAESWEVSPDLTTYTFKLRKGVKFQNGEPFNAQAVKFSFDRAGGEKSTNKDKRTFANLSTQVVDDNTVVILTKEIDPDFPFLLGQATAVIVEPKSADTNATKPVGTGPYRLENWVKGSSVDAGEVGRLPQCGGHQAAARHLPLHRRPGGAGRRAAGRRRRRVRRASRRAACRSSRPTRASRCWWAARAPRPSWRSTTRRSRWTTCACAAPSPRRSTARP